MHTNYVAMIIWKCFFTLLLATVAVTYNKHPLEGLLLVADDRFIRTFDTEGKQRDVIAAMGGLSVDYDCSTGEIFWTNNYESHEIHVIKIGETQPRSTLYKAQNWSPASVTVDFITHKVYIADLLTGTVSLYDMATGKSTVIVNSNLARIISIQLDLEHEYLFIEDEFQILRTDLDGTNHQVIYSEEMVSNQVQRVNYVPSTSYSNFKKRLSISQIVVDSKIKRLYWVGGSNCEVMSMNYQGKDRKMHMQLRRKNIIYASTSLTLLDDYLYWSDGSSNIFKIDLIREKFIVIPLNASPLFIKAVSCWKQPQIPNPCEEHNGHCQDICIYSKKNRNNLKCLCSVGYELSSDNKSCNRVNEYLLFSMSSKLRGLSLTKSDKPSVDKFDPTLIDAKLTLSMDINSKDQQLYFSNPSRNRNINKMCLNDGSQMILVSNIPRTVHTKLAYDWASNNLYYFSEYQAGFMTLNVLNVNNPTYIKVVSGLLIYSRESDIVVHPNRGYVYFSHSLNKNCKISRMNLDGSTPILTYKVSGKYVQAMALDNEKDRLYWIQELYNDDPYESVSSEIYHSNLAGQDIKKIQLPNSYDKKVGAIAIHGRFLYAIVAEASLIRIDKLGDTNELTILVESKTNSLLSNLKVISLANQTPRRDHPCVHSHHCQKFCFAVPSESRGLASICACPQGEKLDSDMRSCVPYANSNRIQGGNSAAAA